MSSPAVGSLSCPRCGDDFSRQDHLTRHMRAHDHDKPFSCSFCGKAFGRRYVGQSAILNPVSLLTSRNRRDSLARHEKGHAENGTIAGHKTIYHRVARACTNCSKSKIRCDGVQPCRYCASKGLECHRELPLRRKRKSRVAPQHGCPIASDQVEGDGLEHESLINDGPNMRTTQPPVPPSVVDCDVRQPLLQSNEGSTPLGLYNPTQFETLAHVASSCVGSSPLPQTPANNSRNDHREEKTTLTNHPPIIKDISLLPLSPISRSDSSVIEADPSSTEPWWQTDVVTAGQESSSESHDIDVRLQMDIGLEPIDCSFLDSQFNITDWMTWEYMDFDAPLRTQTPQSLQLPILSPQVLELSPEMNGALMMDTLRPTPADPNAIVRVADLPGTLPLIPQRSVQADHPTNPVTFSTTTQTRRSILVSFPDFSADDIDIPQSENFGHVAQLPLSAYNGLLKVLGDVCRKNDVADSIRFSSFPSVEVMNRFILLYFEHFLGLFPIIHQPSFSSATLHWIVLLAVAATGSQCSKASSSFQCAHAMSELLRLSVDSIVS